MLSFHTISSLSCKKQYLISLILPLCTFSAYINDFFPVLYVHHGSYRPVDLHRIRNHCPEE